MPKTKKPKKKGAAPGNHNARRGAINMDGRIAFRCTPVELRLMRRAAGGEGVNIWARRLCLEAAKKGGKL